VLVKGISTWLAQIGFVVHLWIFFLLFIGTPSSWQTSYNVTYLLMLLVYNNCIWVHYISFYIKLVKPHKIVTPFRILNRILLLDIFSNAFADGRLRLTLILLTWRMWRAPNNAGKWQMGFNSAFKGLITYSCIAYQFWEYASYTFLRVHGTVG